MTTPFEIAVHAFQERRKETMAYEQETLASLQEKALCAFRKLFGCDPDEINGGQVTLHWYEQRVSMLFHPSGSFKSYWTIQDQCPICDKPAESPELYNLEQIGEQITTFKPSYLHRCPSKDIYTDAQASIERAANAMDNGDREKAIPDLLLSIAQSLDTISRFMGMDPAS